MNKPICENCRYGGPTNTDNRGRKCNLFVICTVKRDNNFTGTRQRKTNWCTSHWFKDKENDNA